MLRPLRSVVDTWKPSLAPGDPLGAIGAAWGGIVGERRRRKCGAARTRGLDLDRDYALECLEQPAAPARAANFERAGGLAGRPEDRADRLPRRDGAPAGALRRGARRNRRTPARERAAAGRRCAGSPRAFAPARRRAARPRAARVRRVRDSARGRRPRALRALRRCSGAHAKRGGSADSLCGAVACDSRETRASRRVWTGPNTIRARRQLLQRWWTTLQRARVAERLSSGRPRTRQVASSYVLLQTGLAPDRITTGGGAQSARRRTSKRCCGAREPIRRSK